MSRHAVHARKLLVLSWMSVYSNRALIEDSIKTRFMLTVLFIQALLPVHSMSFWLDATRHCCRRMISCD